MGSINQRPRKTDGTTAAVAAASGPGATKLVISATELETAAATQARPAIAVRLPARTSHSFRWRRNRILMVRDRSSQQDDRSYGEKDGDEVEASLRGIELLEPVRERQGEQEAEQYLDPKPCHPQLLEQFGEVPVGSLFERFLPTGVIVGRTTGVT